MADLLFFDLRRRRRERRFRTGIQCEIDDFTDEATSESLFHLESHS